MATKNKLADALNAAKAVQQSFNVNASTKIKNLELLYRVNCVNRHFEADSLELTDDEKLDKTQVMAVQYNQRSNVLACGDTNGKVQLFDVFTGKPLDEENNHITQQTTLPALSIKWSPIDQNTLFFANANGSIMTYDRTKKKTNLVVKENNEVTCIDIDQTGRYIASVGHDHRIRVYDLKKDALLTQSYSSANQNLKDKYKLKDHVDVQLEEKAHSNRLFCVKFDKREFDIFYTGGWDRIVKIWDRRTSKGLVNSIYGPNICGDSIDIKGNLLLTASWLKEESLQLWDTRNFEKPYANFVLDNAPDGEYLYAGKFADDANDQNHNILACGTGTKCIHLVNYEKGKNTFTLPCSSPLYCLDSMYSGGLFAAGSTRNFFIGVGSH